MTSVNPVRDVRPEMKFSEMKLEKPTELAGAFGLLTMGRSLKALPSPFRSMPTNGVSTNLIAVDESRRLSIRQAARGQILT